MSNDATRIAVCDTRGIIHVIEITPRSTHKFDLKGRTSYSSPNVVLAFGGSGNKLAFGTQSGLFGLLDCQSGHIVCEMRLGYSIYDVCRVPGREEFVISAGKHIFLLTVQEEEMVVRWSLKRTRNVKCIAASHDGAFIAFSDGEKAVHFCNLPSE